MRKNAKRALILSCLSLLLCVSMLVGSTFAWFTDTDTATVANIVSGTLDVEIVNADGEVKPENETFKFKDANDSTNILWEPGATFRTEGFKLKNNGSLWLKCKVEINNTEVSYNKLNEVISWSLVDGNGNPVSLTNEVSLEPGKDNGTVMYIQGTMSKDADNSYQGLTMDGAAITVYAAQYTKEVDMTNDQYDAAATYDDEVVTVKNADEFIAAFAKLEPGQTITLTDNIDMTGKAWTPVNNKAFVLNGNGKTITGLNGPMVGTTAALEYTFKNVTFKNLTNNGVYGGIANGGVIGYADTCAYINMENVTIDTATISGAEYIGGFVGYTSGYGVDTNGPVNASHNFTNCTIKNATMTSSTDGSIGGLIGHAGSNPATTTRVNGFAYENLTMSQTNANRPEKTGNMIGTCNVGVVYITDADINVATDIGRFVPGNPATGKLYINGVEQQAFANNN